MPQRELSVRFKAFHDPEGDPGLLEAALLVASCDRPAFEEAAVEASFAAMAAAASSYVVGHTHPRAQAEGLCYYLKDVLGLQGDPDRYDDADNSYIDQVLATGRGIPITLAVIYVELGRRLGLRGEGVNFPGHFLVRLRAEDDSLPPVLLDPFLGRVISHADCQALLEQMQPGDITLGPQHLQTASAQQVLVRMFNNLKQLALAQRDWLALIRHSRHIQQADPGQHLEYRDRALAYEQLNDWDAAIGEWDGLLGRMPEGAQRRQLEKRMATLEMQARAERVIH